MNETLNAAGGANPYGLTALVTQTDAVGMAVIVLLVAMSVASWYFIASKALEQVALRRAAQQTPQAFWAAADLAEAERDARARAGDPFAALALAGIDASHAHAASTRSLGAACDLSDFITRALRQSMVATTELAGPDRADRRWQVVDHQLDLAGHQRHARRPAALERDVHDVGQLRHHLEQLGRQVHEVPFPEEAIESLPGRDFA